MTIPALDMLQSQEEARDYAIEWQNWVSEQNLSYEELANWASFFAQIGIKFNLTGEFQENGII